MRTSQPRGIDDGEQDELDHQGSVGRQALNADVSEGDEHSSPDRLQAAAINRSTSAASVKYSLGLCLALGKRRSVPFAVVGAASVIVDFSCVGALLVRLVFVIVGLYEQSQPIPRRVRCVYFITTESTAISKSPARAKPPPGAKNRAIDRPQYTPAQKIQSFECPKGHRARTGLCEFRLGPDRPLFLLPKLARVLVGSANGHDIRTEHNPKGVVADDRNFDKDANDRNHYHHERGDKSPFHLRPPGMIRQRWPDIKLPDPE
jgi:hypothetical protein